MRWRVLVPGGAAVASLVLLTTICHGDWEAQPPGILPLNHMTRSIHVVDENTVWAVSDTTDPAFFTYTPRFARTTDGGASWTSGTIPGTSGFLLSDVFALDLDTAWVAGFALDFSAGGVYRTTDGGASWEQQLAGPWIWVTFFDSANGVAVFLGSARTTSDGGTTWLPAQTPPPGPGANFHSGNNSRAVVGNTMWIVAHGGRVQKSTDRGRNWTLHTTSLPPVARTYGIAFKDAAHGLVCTWHQGQNHLGRTTDGGLTWNALTAPGVPRAYCITDVPQTGGGYMIVAGEEELPFGGFGGSTYTLDDGQTWSQVDGVFHSGVDFLDPLIGWAGGSSDPNTSGIYKWRGTVLGVDSQAAGPAPDPGLSQIYPNPFNPQTTIRFNQRSRGRATVRIFDSMGRFVARPYDRLADPGEHEVRWDGRSQDGARLPSGTYFYRIESAGHRLTGRMVMAK